MQNEKKIHAIIIYDIEDNKRRRELMKFLRGFCFRIQRSAFEGNISEKNYVKLLNKIGKYAMDNDNIRIYKLPLHQQASNFGKEVIVYRKEVEII